MGLGDNVYGNSMSSFYKSKIKKTPEQLQAEDPLAAAVNKPSYEIDFSSGTFQPMETAEPKDIVEEKVGATNLGVKELPKADYTPSGGDKAANTASKLAKAVPNPYVQGAAAVLDTAQAIYATQQQQKMNRYNAEIAKINARQNAIQSMAQLGAGLKA